MKRAIIITRGRVQRVGYRDLVADWAMDLDVVGFINKDKTTETQRHGGGKKQHDLWHYLP